MERKTRLTKLSRLPRRSAKAVRVVLNRRLAHLPARLRQAITYDNGSENTEHQLVNAVLKTASYFCTPCHSWEHETP